MCVGGCIQTRVEGLHSGDPECKYAGAAFFFNIYIYVAFFTYGWKEKKEKKRKNEKIWKNDEKIEKIVKKWKNIEKMFKKRRKVNRKERNEGKKDGRNKLLHTQKLEK